MRKDRKPSGAAMKAKTQLSISRAKSPALLGPLGLLRVVDGTEPGLPRSLGEVVGLAAEGWGAE